MGGSFTGGPPLFCPITYPCPTGAKPVQAILVRFRATLAAMIYYILDRREFVLWTHKNRELARWGRARAVHRAVQDIERVAKETVSHANP